MHDLTTNQKGAPAEVAISKVEEGEIDAVAAYCQELDTCYLLPTSMSVKRAAVQLRLAAPRNNQKRKIHWAEDYELAATLSAPGPIAQLGER